MVFYSLVKLYGNYQCIFIYFLFLSVFLFFGSLRFLFLFLISRNERGFRFLSFFLFSVSFYLLVFFFMMAILVSLCPFIWGGNIAIQTFNYYYTCITKIDGSMKIKITFPIPNFTPFARLCDSYIRISVIKSFFLAKKDHAIKGIKNKREKCAHKK